MKENILFYICIYVMVSMFGSSILAQTIEQQLVVVQNDGAIGGNFKVAVQVKGTSLPAANTIGSATIDVQFNNVHLTYVDATNSLPADGPSFLNGYSKTNTNIGTFIRIGVLGTTIFPGAFQGFDLGTSYTTWSTLNFTIQNTVNTSLTINDVTNAIGLYENHANNPNTGVINNQPLTSPVNIIDVSLPVELSSFTGKVIDGTKVDLNWVTKTEVNNYGFNVERRINESEWDSITFIEGHGNSNSPKQYSYSDKDLFAGGSKFQYRLKQVDNDGSFEYSDVVEVEIAPNQYELSQNYPNPFNPGTTIRFSLPKQTQLKINLYNMLGELVETIAEGNYEAGNYKVTFNAINLPSGVYVYRIESSDFVQTKKMMLMK